MTPHQRVSAHTPRLWKDPVGVARPALFGLDSRGASGHHAADGRSRGPGGDGSGARAVVTEKTKLSLLEMKHLVAEKMRSFLDVVKPFAVRSKDKLVYVVPNVKASITRDVQSHVKDMNSDDMETFRVLIDEEVDTMIGQVQDDHRTAEPAAAEPAHDAPVFVQASKPLRPTEPVRPPVRPSEPFRARHLRRGPRAVAVRPGAPQARRRAVPLCAGPARARMAGAPGPLRRPQAVHRGVRPRRLPRLLPPRDARSALTPSRSSTAARPRSPSTPSPPSAVGTTSGAN